MTATEVVNVLKSRPDTSKLPLIIHTAFELSKAERAELKLGSTRFVLKMTLQSDLLAQLVLEFMP
jgi:response regulator RpfG family c-di-GMP phosphodiesterase